MSTHTAPPQVLDVGCGIGGTSRFLANKFPQASVTGVCAACLRPADYILFGKNRWPLRCIADLP